MDRKTFKWLVPATFLAVPLWFGLAHHVDAKGEDAAPAAPFTDDHGTLKVPEGSPLRGRLAVQAVTVTQTSHKIQLPGQVDADPARTVNIPSPLTGHIDSLKVGLGDVVKKGQLLAVIASGDMAQAYSDYEKAADALDLAKKARERTHGVEKVGAAATKDIEAADSAYNQAQAELTRAQTRLLALGGKPGSKAGDHQLDIVAPVDGVITALNVGHGGNVGDTTTPLFTLSDLSVVWVTANVPENLVGTVRRGQEAEVTLSAYPGQTLHGKVSSVATVLAPDTRRLPVHMTFTNADGHLMPNMFATVTIDVPQQTEVLVPQSALLMNND
jgi:cobalt-zinc-cadmium efflux system membrane fusion protein